MLVSLQMRRNEDEIRNRVLELKMKKSTRDYHSRLGGRIRELQWVLGLREADKL